MHLLESWNPILPPFIRDNILDQLVLPKVKKAVEDWDPRRVKGGKAKSLAQVVFPWLPSLGERIEDVLDGAKRRIRSVLRNWVVKDGVPEELSRWRKDVRTLANALISIADCCARCTVQASGTSLSCNMSFQNWASVFGRTS